MLAHQQSRLLKYLCDGSEVSLSNAIKNIAIRCLHCWLGRFGGLLHDWPESYFKAQQSKGEGLAGIFRQAMDQNQAKKITRSRSILARMFPQSPLARLKSLKVCSSCLMPVAKRKLKRLLSGASQGCQLEGLSY